MAIEAFINEFGITNFSGSYFKNHLDKLSLMSKLVIIPKLAKKTELDSDSQLFQDVKWLIEFRNQLVHFRSKRRNITEIDMTNPMSQKDFVMEEHSERAVSSMQSLIAILGK